MRKSKKEKNIQEYLETLSTMSPEQIFFFTNAHYLTECCNYPANKAIKIVEREWDKLMEKIGEKKRYD